MNKASGPAPRKPPRTLTEHPPGGIRFPAWAQFSCSVVSNSLRPHGLQHPRLPCPSPTPGVYSNSSIESVMPSNHLILCCPLLLPLSIFPSIRVFSYEPVLHIRWSEYWSFSFSISPSISFMRTGWMQRQTPTTFTPCVLSNGCPLRA